MHTSNREESADEPINYYSDLPSRGIGEFFRLCLRKIIFTPFWESAHKIATLIICVIGAAAYFGPRLWPVLPRVEDWVILTTVIAGLLLFRCITGASCELRKFSRAGSIRQPLATASRL